MRDMWVYAGDAGTVNATAIPLRNDKWLVVDTGGTEADGQYFAKRVAELGEVAFVFNTHEHGDHLQGNRFFSCPLVSSIPSKRAISEMPGICCSSSPLVAFDDRLEIDLGEPLLMQLMGGHCPGASILYLPERRLLFTGDLVFNGRLPWMGQADFHLWMDNLNLLASWDVDTVVPGHGPVGGREILTAQSEFLASFVQEVKRASESGQTKEDILASLNIKYAVPERWNQMLVRAVQLAIEA